MPSKTALATSLTSALVGDGAVTIDSSICVAVMTGTPRSTHSRMIAFCRWGTSSSGQSIPRSPRATITASADSTMATRSANAALVSIFATRAARPATTARTCSRSEAARTKDTAMNSTPAEAIASASTRSSSVGVVRPSRSDDRWTPGAP